MYFAKSTNGFYTEDIHGDQIPPDAYEITIEEHAALLAGQSAGKIITGDSDGRPFLSNPPALTPEQIAANYAAAVQSHMDAAAVAAGYDDIKTAVTYADEPAIARFQSEGSAFRTWRSLCWDYCYVQLAAVQSGARSQPTIPAFLAELPALNLS